MDIAHFEQQLRAFQSSRILLTAIEVNLFSAIAEPSTAADAARRLHIEPRATELLLNAVVALGYATKSGEVFDMHPADAEWLTDPAYRTALLHYVHRWDTWSNLTQRVQGVAPAEDFRSLPPAAHESYLAMQNLRSSRRASTVAAALNPGNKPYRVLDLGGGTAPYSIALAQLNPLLEADIVELPELAPITLQSIATANLTPRLRVVAGDLHDAAWPPVYDLVLLCSVAHLFGEAANRALFQRCREALAPGGRLAIHDHLLEPGKTAPRQSAIFAINMLVATPMGATYSVEEYTEWLTAAGFGAIERVPTGNDVGLLIAHR